MARQPIPVYQSLTPLPEAQRGNVLAIGNFDGVHRGHRALLAQAKKMAQSLEKPLSVLTFEPHPRALFRPDDPPFRLTPINKKVELLAQCGVDFIAAPTFDWDFASQPAAVFIDRVLKDWLSPTHIFTGADFKFGQLRQGSIETMREAGLNATAIDALTDPKGQIYSSTAARQALRDGDAARANDILGWPWEIEGVIFRGDRRGHELGYPTANIKLGDTLHPAYGVWATHVQIEGEDIWRPAATNIGIRPMFAVQEGQIEAHILDFEDRDIYDRLLRVRPVSRLRGEAKFSSLDALIAQMDKDCAQARHILLNTPAI